MFRFTCSVVLWGGGGAEDKFHWPVWGALTVFRPHWVCPLSWVCSFAIYTVQAPGCSIGSGPCIACSSSFQVLHKSTDSIGPVFCAFPGLSSSGNRSLMSALSPGAVRLIPLAVPASVSTSLCWVCLVSVLGSWSRAMTLQADVTHSESQEVFG